MSITADPAPSNKTKKFIGIDSWTLFPKLNTIPKDSSAATVIKIPRKNKMDGISIFDKALKIGLLEWLSESLEESLERLCKLNCLELKISPTKVTIAKESIIPT